MTSYTTIGGELLDDIAWRHYGRQIGTTEALLDANPSLAALGPILPAGVTITLPALTVGPLSVPVKLYD